jgi:hypothetical protein
VRFQTGTLAATAALFTASTPPARATGSLVVQVGDAVTGAFIAGAQVQLPSAGIVARTRWDGEVRFDGLKSGRYRIDVRAIGYASGTVDVALTGDTLPVHFRLAPVSTSLDTVRVKATTLARGLGEFEARRKHGIGRFFTDSALFEHRSLGMQVLLATRIPGITALGSGVSGERCAVNFYLDGFRLTEPPDLRYPRVLDLGGFRLEEFSGIEVYSEATVPVQYKPANGACAVVLLWTKWEAAGTRP